MLSVSLDANGWTIVTPSVDTQIIYVSSSLGSDSNNGLSIAKPVKSLSKATSLMRSGLSRLDAAACGDVFNDSFSSWTKSGRRANEPMLIGNYGSGAHRRCWIPEPPATVFLRHRVARPLAFWM